MGEVQVICSCNIKKKLGEINMRWNTPENNQKRIKFGFLFFPKGTTEIRWLEIAKWEEVYEEYDDGEDLYSEWVFHRWVNE